MCRALCLLIHKYALSQSLFCSMFLCLVKSAESADVLLTALCILLYPIFYASFTTNYINAISLVSGTFFLFHANIVSIMLLLYKLIE